MKDMILIITNSKEVAVQRVVGYLNELQQHFFVINTDELSGEDIGLTYINNPSGFIGFRGKKINLNQVKCVWYRRPQDPTNFPPMDSVSKDFVQGEYRAFLWSLYTSLEAFWVNSPLATRLLEHNKFFQIREAARVGLCVPQTIITNNPEELLSFLEGHQGVGVVKALSPAVINAGTESSKFIYTNVVSKEAIADHKKDIKLAPVFMQEYIEKKIELRVTIVGDSVFTCAIHSQDSDRSKHDWRRYDFEKVKHEPYQLPSLVKDQLQLLMKRFGLAYGAFDVILTPKNEYVFLEVNPSGQWEWIEVLTGMPISQAIANMLSTACH